MNKVLLFIIVAFVSCKSSNVGNSVEGKYNNKGKYHNYSLILINDNTFIYKKHDLDVDKSCSGKWHYINQDTILILCDEESVIHQITTGYMQERENEVIIVSRNKIKINKLFYKKEHSN